MPLITRIALIFAAAAAAGAFLTDFPVPIAAGAAAVLLLFRNDAEPALLCAIAIAGVALGGLKASADRARCPAIADRTAIDLVGVVHVTPTQAQRTVPVRAASGCMLRVRVPDEDTGFTMGDEVRVRGEWMTLRINNDRRQQHHGVILASSMEHHADGARHPLLLARARAQARIQELFPVAYPLAEALLIAQRENIDVDVKETFAASGLTHLLAISGTHVALVAAALLLMARLMRVSRSAAALMSLTGSAAYVLLLGAPYAALRALFQMALLLGSRSLQRPAHPLGLLSAAAVAITLIDPAAPLDAGFQLSFAGICGIVLWRRPLIDLMPDSIPVPVRDAIATTCAATAITTPIAGFHFGTVSVIALVANLLAIPVVTLAVPTAAAALAISAVSMDVARSVAAGSELTMLWLSAIAQKCAAVPGGHFAVTPLQVTAGTGAVAASYWVVSHIRIFAYSHILTRITAATLAGLLPLTILAPGATQTLAIHMIDVGQGDALAIRSPRGRWLLIDAGPASDRFNAGKSQVVPFLLRHQASRVSAAIISHPHLDHFGGLAAVNERVSVGAVIDPAMAVPSVEYDSLLALAERTKLQWLRARTGSTIDFDGARLEFLAPEAVPLDAGADANEYSLVVRLDFGEFSALFMGDLPTAQERKLVQHYGERLDVDLLKVAHHGSAGSSSMELLMATSPDVALVPVGRRNRYRHPHPAALARLEQAGARIFRTDEDGSVTVRIDAAGRMTVATRQ